MPTELEEQSQFHTNVIDITYNNEPTEYLLRRKVGT